MIYSLHGAVTSILDTQVVVDVNHVGYLVQCTVPHVQSLQVGALVDIIIYHHIKEDNQQLFGFESADERSFFELLISVSGIGPKVALAMMSSVPVSDLSRAIQTDNIMLITQCQGVGKKTAERLVIELKDKVSHVAVVEAVSETMQDAPPAHDSEDIVMALRQLGYQKDEIKRGFIKHARELATVDAIEDQIKVLLKYL